MKQFLNEKVIRTVGGVKHVSVTIVEPAPTEDDPDAVSSVTCLMTKAELDAIKSGD